MYQQSLKQEEQFELILEDGFQDSLSSTDLVDFSVGAGGSVGYLNLRGFYRAERTNKVQRMAEIIDEIKESGVIVNVTPASQGTNT